MSLDLTQVVGIVAGICTAVSLLPQLLKIIRSKKADDISLFYLIILLCGLSLWIWYGFLREDIPIIATNSFSLLLNVAIIVLGVRYKKRSRSSH
ncbi:MAG TPA: SemiSWEET transporter [Ohtaekwangia sp.]|nr:SemiSWEET transporter [Ohtaekwangia sp.]